MTDFPDETGLYWQALGGNNIDQISGHCYQYTDIISHNRKLEASTLIVDIGKFDNHQALNVPGSSAAVPDVRELLTEARWNLKAVFLTHSHPDHLNGIVHYLKAGFRLPDLYGGKYTFMILEQLYDEFEVPADCRPQCHIIRDGDKIKIASFAVEVLASSHTCFDSFGLVISTADTTIYHTGDMKIDNSTCFRKPTNIKRLRELSAQIDCVVADFYGIYDDGFAVKESSTYKKLVGLIKKSGREKIFLPVYPTHPEMYLIAFLAALKLRKNVVFFGNPDFYGYLRLIMDYGISFDKMAAGRIKVIYSHDREEIKTLDENYVVIGTYNHVSLAFDADRRNSFGIITAKTFFNPFKGQLNAHNIPFVTVDDYPELQGFGHGFLGDYEYLNSLLNQPVFIPTHCPVFVIDNFRELADFIGIRLIDNTPCNGELYKISGRECRLLRRQPANWLVVTYQNNLACLTAVPQRATSGVGFLKRTISNRRCRRRFKIYLHARRRAKNNADKKI